MRVKVKMNNAAISKLKWARLEALELTAESVKTDAIAKNVFPFDTGTLQNDSTSIDTHQIGTGKVAISSNTPYARRLYFHPEYNFQKDKNPNAQGRWWDPWISGNRKDFAKKAYKEHYKRLTGV